MTIALWILAIPLAQIGLLVFLTLKDENRMARDKKAYGERTKHLEVRPKFIVE
jgi:hypothetical protein